VGGAGVLMEVRGQLERWKEGTEGGREGGREGPREGPREGGRKVHSFYHMGPGHGNQADSLGSQCPRD